MDNLRASHLSLWRQPMCTTTCKIGCSVDCAVRLSRQLMKSMRPILWRISTSHMCEVRKKHGGPLSLRDCNTQACGWVFLASLDASHDCFYCLSRRLPHFHTAARASIGFADRFATRPRSWLSPLGVSRPFRIVLRDSERLRFVHWRG